MPNIWPVNFSSLPPLQPSTPSLNNPTSHIFANHIKKIENTNTPPEKDIRSNINNQLSNWHHNGKQNWIKIAQSIPATESRPPFAPNQSARLKRSAIDSATTTEFGRIRHRNQHTARVNCLADNVKRVDGKSGGSNKAIYVEITDNNSPKLNRIKDSRVPKHFLKNFEPDLAEKLDLDSNFYPAAEVIMSQVFKATGLEAPTMRLTENCESMFNPSTPTSTSGKEYAAYEFDHDYMNLGEFLVSPHGRNQILSAFPKNSGAYNEAAEEYDNNIKKYRSACTHLENILDGKKFYEIEKHENAKINMYRKHDIERFSALENLNRMLPEPLLHQQQVHYLMSRFVDNWDHLNFRMENFGYTKRGGKWIGKTLDFDTTGPLGFMGTPKHLGHRIADIQRPVALFRLNHQDSNYDDFLKDRMPRLINIHTQPYGQQSRTSVEQLVAAHKEANHYNNQRAHLYFDRRYQSALEFGYRLSQLSDNAINSITSTNFKRAPAEFNLEKEADLSNILISRRDHFLKEIGLTWINRWSRENPDRVDAINREIINAASALKIDSPTFQS
ncbi:hypothetical protein KDW36_13715 [Burkholderia dolosa]|uniref:hypothetical protein n=1 Tax=Burkholderia dolosa TaxID=152500 RepID=UPI001B95D7C7|nr:hypothetical protein [Burkholderia dolosa]MBR8314250.1 hypothetical protein [Burkholderia dolosa]